MADFPYITNAAKLKKFFDQMPSMAVPDNITIKVLESLGYKSRNDRPIIKILMFIDFVDSSGKPTEKWLRYRDKTQSRIVLGQAICEAYHSLFSLYPDAYLKDDKDLRNFFGSNTTVGESTLTYITRTFKTLCEYANFEELSSFSVDNNNDDDGEPIGIQSVKDKTRETRELTVNVNLQLHLPATDNATIYNKLFEALKRHLLS